MTFVKNFGPAKIYHDSDAEAPEVAKIAILHRRYHNPSPDLGTPEQVELWVQSHGIEYAIYWLWMYDHSYRAFKVTEPGASNPFTCRWDSGRVGILALPRDSFPTANLAQAQAAADTYQLWANGEVYGYEVGSVSCWGFYGMDAVEAEITYIYGEPK